MLRVARGVPVLVRVFDEADATWVMRHGGIPVVYSLASADNLMDWYEEQSEELEERLRLRMAGRPAEAAE